MLDRVSRLFRFSLLLAVSAGGWLLWFANTPMDTGRTDYPLAFSVERGSSLKLAAQSLQQAGVLDRPWAFVLLARLRGKAGEIKAGSYAVERAVTPLELLRKITEGDTLLGKLAVIEGWTFAQMRKALDAHPGLRHDSANMSEAKLMESIGAAKATDRAAATSNTPDANMEEPCATVFALFGITKGPP